MFDMLGTTIIFIAGILMGAVICGLLMENTHQREAISRGHATYVVNANGNSEFKWNEPCTSK